MYNITWMSHRLRKFDKCNEAVLRKGLYIFLAVITLSCGPKDQSSENLELEDQPSTLSASKNIIRVSTPANLSGLGHLKTMVEKAYANIGYRAVFIQMPAVRSLHDSNEGIHADAEMVRTLIVQNRMNNSLRIPVPLGTIEFCAVVKNSQIKINSWEDFKKYTVAVISGYVFAEKYVNGNNVQKVENTEQALALLQNDRVEAAVLLKSEAEYLIKILGYEKIQILTPPVDSSKVYHFINKKFENLVPELTNAFKELTGNDIDQ